MDAGHRKRYADLVRLVVRHGRRDLLAGVQTDEFLVEEGEAFDVGASDGAGPERLAADLEQMGPTFIKLGQLLSTRVDLLPPAYTDALARLQDDVEPFGADEVRAIVEEELGAPIRSLFSDFDDAPLAAASLAQVHRATTRNGRDVVVKVQRPGVREAVRGDMEVLSSIAGKVDRHTEVGRRYGIDNLLSHFRRSLAGELDYRQEAQHLIRFGELTAEYSHLVVPQPVTELSTSRVLTMDFVAGRPVTTVGPFGLLDVDTRPLVEELFSAYLRMILVDGTLHADPHPGNVLLTDDGRLALIDFGMVAAVPRRVRDQVVKLLLALSEGDGEEAALVLAEMGHPLAGYDAAKFRDDVSHLVSTAVTMGSDVDAGTVLVELSRLSGQHGLRPPAEMAMIGKTLLNLDQVTQHLDPSFDPSEAIRDNIEELLRGGLSVSLSGAISSAIEAKDFAAQLPRRANRIMDALSDGELAFRVKTIDEVRLVSVLQHLANRLTMGIVLAAIVVGAALMMQVPTTSRILGYPAIAMVFFIVAAIAGAVLVGSILITDRREARAARRAREQ
ncbi:ABC1 kinase family protein [Intrasporangium calvum]|uniref:ABC1 kinase family protein n=1 Tax=Intrasporangium calvum TaxID=53358 RepID=UPI000DF5CA21|nr:AarF/UbiB family protein [Intrasporangium calvum]AXG12784.1 AarF/ABC1/UbiB kinase family protein [Intrasporangium calvum]